MKISITIPEATHNLLLEYIQRRFGPGSIRVKSSIITAAIRYYIFPEFDPTRKPNHEPKPLEH